MHVIVPCQPVASTGHTTAAWGRRGSQRSTHTTTFASETTVITIRVTDSRHFTAADSILPLSQPPWWFRGGTWLKNHHRTVTLCSCVKSKLKSGSQEFWGLNQGPNLLKSKVKLYHQVKTKGERSRTLVESEGRQREDHTYKFRFLASD